MLDTIALGFRVEVEPVREPQANPKFTAMVVYEGDDQWTALCTQLDIATVGATPDAALGSLRDAVREAIDLAAEKHLSPGEPVAYEAQAELLASHQPDHGPPVIIHFSV